MCNSASPVLLFLKLALNFTAPPGSSPKLKPTKCLYYSYFHGCENASTRIHILVHGTNVSVCNHKWKYMQHEAMLVLRLLFLDEQLPLVPVCENTMALCRLGYESH